MSRDEGPAGEATAGEATSDPSSTASRAPVMVHDAPIVGCA